MKAQRAAVRAKRQPRGAQRSGQKVLKQWSHKEIVMKEGEELKLIYELPAGLQAPVSEDEIVGKIHYIINGQTLMTESLTVGTTIKKMELPDYFKLTGRYFTLNN